MAFDEYIADRIQQVMTDHKSPFHTKKMMGGLIFMVNNKMCCGIHIDKKYGDTLLMAKIGEEKYETEISKTETLPMDFTGRPMKGFIYVTPEGFDTDESLDYWVSLALEYNFKQNGLIK